MKKSDLLHLKNTNRPVLVTGHTGFKGAWLTLLLEKMGVEVFGISLPPTKDSLYTRLNRLGKIDEAFIDIRDLKELRKCVLEVNPEIAIHMAALPLVLKSYESPLETFETNVMGTANLLDSALRTSNCKVIAVITTDKVYKNENSNFKFRENDPLFGYDPYSLSKVGAEAVSQAWKQISRYQNGPEVFTLRAGNVIGGGDLSENRLVPDFVRAKISGKPIVIRNPSSTRPWQHVLDPLFGYLAAVNQSLAGKKFDSINFGPNENSLSVNQVQQVISKKWNIGIEIKENSNKISSKESHFLDLDNSFARRLLNWTPKWTQIEAIHKTIEWWDSVLRSEKSPLEACDEDVHNYLA